MSTRASEREITRKLDALMGEYAFVVHVNDHHTPDGFCSVPTKFSPSDIQANQLEAWEREMQALRIKISHLRGECEKPSTTAPIGVLVRILEDGMIVARRACRVADIKRDCSDRNVGDPEN